MPQLLAAVAVAVTVAFLPGLAQSPAPAAPGGTGAISGTVKDGVTGRPLAGAVVALRAAGTGAPLARIVRQVTDDRGRFVFIDLPPSTYTIATTRIGYVDGAYGQTAILGVAGRIALDPGEWFGEAHILMWKPGAVSGRVLDEHAEPLVGVYVRVLARQHVTGRPQLVAGPVAMTDDRGEYRIAGLGPGTYLVHVPSVQTTVPGELLAAARDGGAEPLGGARPLFTSFAPASRTDAALDPIGSSRLVVGNYATPPPPVEGRGQAYPMTFYPAASSYAAAEPIELRLGEERRGVDVAVRPVPTSRIFGSVQGPPEALSGLVLRLMPAGLDDLGTGGEAATTVVDASGRFAFLNVPAGDYVIDAPRTPLELTYQPGASTAALPLAPGVKLSGSQSGSIASGAPGTGYMRRSGQGDDTYWTRVTVTVGSSDLSNVAVPLQPSVRLTGRIVYEGTTRLTIESMPVTVAGAGLTGTARTIETTPVPDRTPTVYAEPASGAPSLGLPRSNPGADGASDGAFRIDGLKGGEYVLRIPAGAERFAIKSISVDGTDYTTKPIDASRLGGRHEAVLTLTDKIITVAGLVEAEHGGIAEAAVIAFPVEPEQWTTYGLTPLRIKAAPAVDRTGYTIAGLPAGDYFLAAVDPTLMSAWQDPAFLERAARVALRVTLAWGEARTVNLKLAAIR